METRVVLVTPKPVFVAKTSTTAPGFYTEDGHPVSVSASHKVFINITHSAAIPPPPLALMGVAPGSPQEEAAIHAAMSGDPASPYVVPIVVSDGRADADKAGKAALVFDATFHTSVKARVLRDVDFRSFVLEIILSQIESPGGTSKTAEPRRALSLSRALATPNIRSKGPLEPRQVTVPVFSASDPDASPAKATSPSRSSPQPPPAHKPPLIEELPSADAAPKSILKKGRAQPTAELQARSESAEDPRARRTPGWRWERDKAQDVRTLVLDLPTFIRAHHPAANLELAPDLLTFSSDTYFLRLPLDDVSQEAVDKARAEWRVAERRLVVYL